MNRVRVPAAVPRRVYTILSVLLVALGPAALDAQNPVDLTIEPSMVKGPLNAPVTIVEFSDYQ